MDDAALVRVGQAAEHVDEDVDFLEQRERDLLVQRVYRIAGHCGFNETEQAKSFDDVVKWVRAGVKPEGDNINDDLRDAGRKFTSPLRENDPGTLTVAAPAPVR